MSRRPLPLAALALSVCLLTSACQPAASTLQPAEVANTDAAPAQTPPPGLPAPAAATTVLEGRVSFLDRPLANVQLVVFDAYTDRPLGVVSAGGANVVSAGGANVVSAGGANVVSAGGANVVSAGGANVVSAGGANVVSAGGANVVSAGGANVVSAGGLNYAVAQVGPSEPQLVSMGPTDADGRYRVELTNLAPGQAIRIVAVDDAQTLETLVIGRGPGQKPYHLLGTAMVGIDETSMLIARITNGIVKASAVLPPTTAEASITTALDTLNQLEAELLATSRRLPGLVREVVARLQAELRTAKIKRSQEALVAVTDRLAAINDPARQERLAAAVGSGNLHTDMLRLYAEVLKGDDAEAWFRRHVMGRNSVHVVGLHVGTLRALRPTPASERLAAIGGEWYNRLLRDDLARRAEAAASRARQVLAGWLGAMAFDGRGDLEALFTTLKAADTAAERQFVLHAAGALPPASARAMLRAAARAPGVPADGELQSALRAEQASPTDASIAALPDEAAQRAAQAYVRSTLERQGLRVEAGMTMLSLLIDGLLVADARQGLLGGLTRLTDDEARALLGSVARQGVSEAQLRGLGVAMRAGASPYRVSQVNLDADLREALNEIHLAFNRAMLDTDTDAQIQAIRRLVTEAGLGGKVNQAVADAIRHVAVDAKAAGQQANFEAQLATIRLVGTPLEVRVNLTQGTFTLINTETGRAVDAGSSADLAPVIGTTAAPAGSGSGGGTPAATPTPSILSGTAGSN